MASAMISDVVGVITRDFHNAFRVGSRDSKSDSSRSRGAIFLVDGLVSLGRNIRLVGSAVNLGKNKAWGNFREIP
jgi:hypothetical protein